MTATEADKLILEKAAFAGEISVNGETAPITFRVSAGADCRLLFDVDDPLDARTYLLAVRGQGVPGTSTQEFKLTGKSADGKTIASESVSFGAHGFNRISLSSRASKITLTLDRPVDKPLLRLWFRSLLAFRNPVIETPLGRLVVQGEATGVSPDDMSGSATLEALSSDPSADWFGKADNFLRHMHCGLALAHGGRLQTPRLDYVHGRTCEATFFAGAGFNAELPVHHHLNQGPFIKALAERYQRAGPLPDILWRALGWMQTDTTFDEMRFLTAMIALEAIIQSTLPKGLKKKVFVQKLHALFDHYAIPRRDFEGDVICHLVKLRHKIVHEGVVPNDADLWPSIILARELITRILLKEIGFVGRYCCYVGGLNDREFPGETG